LAVSSAIQPGDLTHRESWIRLLGLPFVLKTLYLYGWLTVSPPFLTPIAAALGLSAVVARSCPSQLRASILVYVLFFGIVGQPFNFYWGYVTMGLWAHAFVFAPEGMNGLLRAAVPSLNRWQRDTESPRLTHARQEFAVKGSREGMS
jgi:hypothetical protein